jgi:periplasmic protein CpxP/Spy
MRKIAVFVALAAVVSASAAYAQSAGAPPAGAREGRGPGGRGGPGGMDQMLLRGITLTDAQKSQLEQLRQADRAQMQAGGRQGGGDFEAIRTARQNGDTATANRLMAEQRQKMEVRRDQQVSAIRGILTGDQVAQLDANVAEMKKRQAEMGNREPGARGRGGRPPQL